MYKIFKGKKFDAIKAIDILQTKTSKSQAKWKSARGEEKKKASEATH
jgi:hypothetical protein